MTTTTNRGTLVLPRDICRKLVTGKAGYICVDKNDVRVRRQLVKEWKNSTTRLPHV